MPTTHASIPPDFFGAAALRELATSCGTIRYRDLGHGPPVVFVHGLLSSGLLWRDAANLMAASHRCIVPDWPLGSHTVPMSPGADLSPAGVARLIAEVLGALDLDDVTLVGNDSGGALCQLVAVDHPERLGRLVLTPCDAFEVFPPEGFKYLRWLPRIPGLPLVMARSMLHIPPLRRLSIAYGALSRRPLAGDLLTAFVAPAARSRGVRRDIRKFLRGVSPAVTLRAAERLPGFQRPTLLVWSADDRFFTRDLAERLASVIPGSRLELVEDAGVYLPLDRPDRLASLIQDFTAESPVAARATRPALR